MTFLKGLSVTVSDAEHSTGSREEFGFPLRM